MLAFATLHLSLAEGQILLNRSQKSRKPQTPLLLDLSKAATGVLGRLKRALLAWNRRR